MVGIPPKYSLLGHIHSKIKTPNSINSHAMNIQKQNKIKNALVRNQYLRLSFGLWQMLALPGSFQHTFLRRHGLHKGKLGQNL